MSETLATAVAQIAAVLGIEPPAAGTSPADLRVWLDWWKPSAAAARKLTPAQVAHLKAGRWWPPVTAHQVKTLGPARMVHSPETTAHLEAMFRLELYQSHWAEMLAKLDEEKQAATTVEAAQAIEQRILEHYKRHHVPANKQLSS